MMTQRTKDQVDELFQTVAEGIAAQVAERQSTDVWKDTAEQFRLLEALAVGRGRHAPMGYQDSDGAVRVFYHNQFDSAFNVRTVDQCRQAGWIRLVRGEPRYVITPAGRARRKENV